MFWNNKPEFNFSLKDATILDVRTPMEFAEDHVEGSVNIPLDELTVKIDQVKELKKPLVVCCLSGNRSGKAVQYLESLGMENVYNGGGYEDLKTL